jgi:hypothetical protein
MVTARHILRRAERQQQSRAGAVRIGGHDEGRLAIPTLDDLQAEERRVQLQGVAACLDGLGLTLGADDGGLGLDLRLHLREARLHGLLLGHHFRLNGRSSSEERSMFRMTMS